MCNACQKGYGGMLPQGNLPETACGGFLDLKMVLWNIISMFFLPFSTILT